MRQFIRAAALAVTLLFVPCAAQADTAAPRLATPSIAAFARETAPREAPRAPPLQPRLQSHGELAPGQSKADYYAWLARAPENRARVLAFRDHLAAEGLEDVVPIWQLIRTSSSWRQCAAERFEVAPRDKWDHISTTLRFVRDEVVPALGEVEALSGYRNESLNRCSAGAPASAHRLFFALDLTPLSAGVTRVGMIRSICAAHARDGRAYHTGLGFYTGMRFHVDSNGFRRWGADGRGATSPCGGSYA
ncbi:MAG: hypothetical protein QOD42_3398 [Sphingomonadales bacterium]|jgi:hypothetical protein|nr:hypothetical protein [Sphingomonadales bacterium]